MMRSVFPYLSVVQTTVDDGPSIAKVPPYPRFYNYDPKQNRRSIIHRIPYIPREKAS